LDYLSKSKVDQFHLADSSSWQWRMTKSE